MIKIEQTQVYGWEAAIRGMRNPLNSWNRSDSLFEQDHYNMELRAVESVPCLTIGENDHELMMRLASGGAVHAKYRRMITVTMDITAPLYWWKEYDTYKVGSVANSCSTMHKIHARELALDDFSHEHLTPANLEMLNAVIMSMNVARAKYMHDNDKEQWWQMIQMLPTSYNQRRTVLLNYEVLVGMYRDRKHHKLDEWREFCKWIESLPYPEFITG